MRFLMLNTVTWHLEKPSKWVIANTEGVGYFKVCEDGTQEAIKFIHSIR